LSPRFLLSSAPSSPHFRFFYLGRSPITMRPIQKKTNKNKQTKKQTNKKNKQKKGGWIVFQMTCFLISTSLCKGRVSIYCFQSFQKKKEKIFFLYLLFFINLLHKAKRK
jgi:hypothetical protein